jgi:hypothetical protein
MSDADLSLFFIAEGARLERQSWLLAASLAAAHQGMEGVKLIAYAGVDWLPQISAVTKSIYRVCDVELRPLPPIPDWKKPYPHGNKIVAATDTRDTARSIFLDTDMVCLRPLTEIGGLSERTVAAAPEGRPTWGTENDRWARAYAHFDLPMPTERVTLLRGKRQSFLPYFNAGFVSIPEAPRAEDGKRFADLWLETALDFDHTCAIAQKRPWLDQITLPLTLARFGFETKVLSESYNYSLSHRGDYSQTPAAHILHYHRSRFLEQAPQWPAVRDAFFDMLPKTHHKAATEGLSEMGLTL